MILKARFVVPVEGSVIHNGAVALQQGRIVAVGRARDVTGETVTDYGDAVITPGFVNAHTHLELSSLYGQVPPDEDFIGWLGRLVALRRQNPPTPERVAASVRRGVNECLKYGTTTVGDIASLPQMVRPELAASTIRGVSFGEVIAIGRSLCRWPGRLHTALEPCPTASSIRAGVSPHAPYSVTPKAMQACAVAAKRVHCPLAIHVAESPYEEEFTRYHRGPFLDYLTSLGVLDNQTVRTEDNPSTGRRPLDDSGDSFGRGESLSGPTEVDSACLSLKLSPVELIAQTGLLGSHTVLVHANYVTPQEIAMISRAGASVAFCPRTHRAFGHSPHPFREMLSAGVNVCLGTDSLASNPSLSLLDEMRFLHHSFPDVASLEILQMGTSRGARALGLAHLVGGICEGKCADLAVVPIDPTGNLADWSAIFDTDSPPIATYFNGVCVAGGRPR